jgi:hypothetical protein
VAKSHLRAPGPELYSPIEGPQLRCAIDRRNLARVVVHGTVDAIQVINDEALAACSNDHAHHAIIYDMHHISIEIYPYYYSNTCILLLKHNLYCKPQRKLVRFQREGGSGRAERSKEIFLHL